MKFSVIIPSYNDALVLKQCLEALREQSFQSAFEVVVVDDGSTDDTQEFLSHFDTKEKFQLKIIHQKNNGRSIARNRGVEESSGDIILFLGANILVSKNWLQVHADFHRNNMDEKAMAVGFMTWSQDLQGDRFRRWLESSGIMFSFKGLQDNKKTDLWHFYTGNISLKKSWFQKFQFDTEFKLYGWEDTALGYQMIDKGGELYYLQDAKAYNIRALTKEDLFPYRMIEIGKSALVFQRKYPKVLVVPKGLKKLVFKIISLDIIIAFLSFLRSEWAWYAESKKWFLQGINSQ